MRAQVLIRLLAQHIGSYLELVAGAMDEYRGAWVRRLALALVAVMTGIAGAAALWATGLIALWNTPWRLAYVLISAVILLVTAVWSLRAALMERVSGPRSRVLRSELQKDMELFEQWKSNL